MSADTCRNRKKCLVICYVYSLINTFPDNAFIPASFCPTPQQLKHCVSRRTTHLPVLPPLLDSFFSFCQDASIADVDLDVDKMSWQPTGDDYLTASRPLKTAPSVFGQHQPCWPGRRVGALWQTVHRLISANIACLGRGRCDGRAPAGGRRAGPSGAGPRCLTVTTDSSSISTVFNNGVAGDQPPPTTTPVFHRSIRRLIRFVFARAKIFCLIWSGAYQIERGIMECTTTRPLLTGQH